MKKVLEITGIVLATILVLLIVFICFPWVFTTGIMKKNNPHLQDKMTAKETITAEIPEDWLTVEVNGISISAPAEYKSDSKLIPFNRKDEFVALVDRSSGEEIDEEFTSSFREKFRDACVESFYKKLGYDPKTMTNYDEIEVVRNLDISQYKGTWGMQAAGFAFLADSKEVNSYFETLHYYELDGKKCYFSDYGSSSTYKYGYGIYFPGKNGCLVMVKGNDLDTVEKCLASIKIPEDIK